jgi:hypothetical protein
MINYDDTEAENVFLKLKLLAEFGTSTDEYTDTDPEIENQFLNHILNFEKQFATSTQTTVYKRIGRPSFRKEAMLNDFEISSELRRLEELMEKHGIVLNCICQYSDRKIYTFLMRCLTGNGQTLTQFTFHQTFLLIPACKPLKTSLRE